MSKKMINFTRFMSQTQISDKKKTARPRRRKPARRRKRIRRRRISWFRVSLAVVLFTALILSLTLPTCRHSTSDSPASESVVSPRLDSLCVLLATTDTTTTPKPAVAPDSGCIPLQSRFKASLGRTFNDSNHVHLSAAVLSGILPISDTRTAWQHGRGLVAVRSCKDFYVDRLSHSYPYLTRSGAILLHEIGRRFNDSLAARGGGAYRIKVTSLLRTGHTVGRLRRVNRNATATSAHQYGATFDISYSKFICDDSTATRRSFEDLKNLLAEIVDGLRDEGRCFVKHERRQACFHITARTDNNNNNDNNTPETDTPR
jgi:hypothetical protein